MGSGVGLSRGRGYGEEQQLEPWRCSEVVVEHAVLVRHLLQRGGSGACRTRQASSQRGGSRAPPSDVALVKWLLAMAQQGTALKVPQQYWPTSECGIARSFGLVRQQD